MKKYTDVFLFSRIEMILLSAIVIFLPLISFAPSFYQNSGFETYFNYLQKNPNDNDIYLQYQDISAEVNSSETAANAAIFTVWALVGLVGYALVMAVITFVLKTKKFASKLGYEHTDRKSVLRRTLLELAVRCVGILLLLGWTRLLFSHIIPFLTVMANNIANSSSWNLPMLGSGLAFLVGAVLYIHLFVVSLRVILLRRRVFF